MEYRNSSLYGVNITYLLKKINLPFENDNEIHYQRITDCIITVNMFKYIEVLNLKIHVTI